MGQWVISLFESVFRRDQRSFVEALALNAPLFVQPFLETIRRFSFYNVVRQAVPDFNYPLTVEKFPGVKTASRLVQFESVSTKIMHGYHGSVRKIYYYQRSLFQSVFYMSR